MAEYDYNKIIALNSESDRNTQLLIGVYKGYASLTVWANKAVIVKIPLPRPFLVKASQDLKKIRQGKPGDKTNTVFTKYDVETKKSNSIGSIFFGRDEKSILYIGVAAPNHAPMKFVMKTPLSFDSGEPMSDVQKSELACDAILAQLDHDIPTAMLNTSEKRADIPRLSSNSGGGFDTGSF